MKHNSYPAVSCLSVLLAGITIASAPPATADETGEREYLSACASCHGVDANGTGPMGDFLTIVVPPLNNLSEANGGEFPMQQVIEAIDGRADIRGHGSGMPVWGAVFRDPLAANVTGQSQEFLIRGRILSLAYYLESIQK